MLTGPSCTVYVGVDARATKSTFWQRLELTQFLSDFIGACEAMIKHSMIALTRTAFSAAPFGDDETINLVSEESPTVVVLSGSSGRKQASAVLST